MSVVLSRDDIDFALRAYIRQRYALHRNLRIEVATHALPELLSVGVQNNG